MVAVARGKTLQQPDRMIAGFASHSPQRAGKAPSSGRTSGASTGIPIHLVSCHHGANPVVERRSSSVLSSQVVRCRLGGTAGYRRAARPVVTGASLLAACFVLAGAPGDLAAAQVNADALAQRLGFTPRAGPGQAIEDEWARPDITCTPVAARGVFHAGDKQIIRRPRIELEVNFAFGSAELTADAVDQLHELGEALRRDRLQDQRFLLVGHTDAVGEGAANQALSEARARAVARYLETSEGIGPDRLQARGCGERRLRNPKGPESPLNRRVEVINAGP